MIGKRQVVMGVLVWVLIFGAFVTIAGVGGFVETLMTISGSQLMIILTAVAAGVVAMGTCLYVITRTLDLGFSPIESIFLNTSVSLAHNLTPFGQAGGEPVGAAILSKYSNGSYEECLAALSVKDVVSFTPAILVFVFGGGYLALYEGAIPDRIRPLLAGFAAFVIVVCLAMYAVYRYPDRMRRLLHRCIGSVNGLLTRLPAVPSVDPDELDERVGGFTDSIAEIASDRMTVTLASTFATAAFVAQGCLLWITLGAVGVDVPVALAIFIVPVSLLASALPLPGGTGGVEAVQILLLVTTAAAESTPTITAVVLSRGLVFWTPIVLGTLTLLTLQMRGILDSPSV